jgi:hypothetical protein
MAAFRRHPAGPPFLGERTNGDKRERQTPSFLAPEEFQEHTGTSSTAYIRFAEAEKFAS